MAAREPGGLALSIHVHTYRHARLGANARARPGGSAPGPAPGWFARFRFGTATGLRRQSALVVPGNLARTHVRGRAVHGEPPRPRADAHRGHEPRNAEFQFGANRARALPRAEWEFDAPVHGKTAHGALAGVVPALTLHLLQARKNTTQTMDFIPTPEDFKTLFCQAHGCDPTQFEKRLFWQCVPPLARLPAWVISRLVPGYYSREARFLRSLGSARHLHDFRPTVASTRWHPELRQGVIRGWLGARISRRRLLRVGLDLFPEAGAVPDAPPYKPARAGAGAAPAAPPEAVQRFG